MPKPRVFITRRLPGDAIDHLAEVADIDVWPDPMPPPYGDLVRHAEHADGLICLLTDRIDADLIATAKDLRVIANVAVGYDNIDVAAARERGIAVGNTPGVLTETTADLAFALILATARRIVEADRYVREGKWRTWDPNLLLGADVHGAALGIIGFGKIGRAVAARAAGFGMNILYASRTYADDQQAVSLDAKRLPLYDLLGAADFVSLHVPLTDDTRNMIGDMQLRSMKRSAIIINTARGGIIDQPALVQALEEGWIAGAGLDVAAVEPIPASDALLRAPNTVLLPHIGSASRATRERMATMAVNNCIAGLRNEPLPYPVTPRE